MGDWQLNEGGGTLAGDSSAFENNGTVSGDATWLAGHEGTALGFTGRAGEVTVPSSASLEPSTAVSVAAWVNHSGSPGDYRYILAKGVNGCVAASYGLYTGAHGGIQFYVSHNSGSVYADSPDFGTGIWNGKWHLVVGTFDGTTVRLYVDGKEVGSGSNFPGALDYQLPDSNQLFIGNYPANRPSCMALGFVGVIDDVMIWDGALSASEVSGLMPVPSGSPPVVPGAQAGEITYLPPGETTGSSSSLATGVPTMTELKISPSSFLLGHIGSVKKGKRRAGATVSFRLSEQARSTFTVMLKRAGVRRGKRCVGRSRSRRHVASCTRLIYVGRFTRNDGAGRTSFRFVGLPGRKLRPGKYLLKAAPRAGNAVGKTVSVGFSVRP